MISQEAVSDPYNITQNANKSMPGWEDGVRVVSIDQNHQGQWDLLQKNKIKITIINFHKFNREVCLPQTTMQ